MDSKHKNNCAICYEKIYKSNFTLDCGHKFHISCLNQWRKIGFIASQKAKKHENK